MKDFEKVAELATNARQIFLPNRYQKEFIQPFQDLTGIEVPPMEDRKMTFESDGRTFRYIRGRNVPMVVNAVNKQFPDARSVGLTGTEWCVEYNLGSFNRPNDRVDTYRMTEEPYGSVNVITPPDYGYFEPFYLGRSPRGIGVVTPYPNLVTSEYLGGRLNIFPAYVVEGGVEPVADALNMPAVDLVCSSNTVKTNGFTIVQKILDVYPMLVTSPREERQC